MFDATHNLGCHRRVDDSVSVMLTKKIGPRADAYAID